MHIQSDYTEYFGVQWNISILSYWLTMICDHFNECRRTNMREEASARTICSKIGSRKDYYVQHPISDGPHVVSEESKSVGYNSQNIVLHS